MLRHVLAAPLDRWSGDSGFPTGILVVNVLGCFLIGWLAHGTFVDEGTSSNTRAFVLVGLLGGFTTFSTFGLQTVELLRAAEHGKALVYVGLSNLGGLGAVALGIWLSSRTG